MKKQTAFTPEEREIRFELACKQYATLVMSIPIRFPEVHARHLARLDKLTAQAAASQAIHRSNRGYTRLEALGFIAVLLAYLLAGSIGATHWTPNGTVAEGSNYHQF